MSTMRRLLYTCFWVLSLQSGLSAQTMVITDNSIAQSYSFVRTVFNRITDPSGLDSFYHRLYQVKTGGKGVVSIVHIGDSHIQADFLPGEVRNGLQDFFSNAGRGLVFPYQLARSNAPADIVSSSNTTWQFNRLAHPEIPMEVGITGYGIRSSAESAFISFSLKTGSTGSPSFDRLKFFLDTNASCQWQLRAGGKDTVFYSDSSLYKEFLLGESTASFILSATGSPGTKAFYGVSLEKSVPGVLYHTIGVNGARYDHYNQALVFWKQLAALKADLFIVSLGTNEAQGAFHEKNLTEQVSLFLAKLRAVSPHASILITTAADSYRQRRPNAVLKQVNLSLRAFCQREAIPFWDLYAITGGYGSAHSWSRRRLMSRDRVHFTAEGYRIQGRLLLNALAKGYNSYIANF